MEDSVIDELPEQVGPKSTGNFFVNVGAVIAVLLGIPSLFIGLFSVTGVLSGEKLIAGFLGTAWGYLAVVGSYELNRRKFRWVRGSTYSDRHLLSGTLAASIGLMVSGALNETMPILVIIPVISAILQASDGHETKYRSMIHAAVLVVGAAIGLWLYIDGVTGKLWLEMIEALP